MKRVLILAIMGLMINSCKKEYVCECVIIFPDKSTILPNATQSNSYDTAKCYTSISETTLTTQYFIQNNQKAKNACVHESYDKNSDGIVDKKECKVIYE